MPGEDLTLKVLYGEPTLGTQPQPQSTNNGMSSTTRIQAMKNSASITLGIGIINSAKNNIVNNAGALFDNTRLQQQANLLSTGIGLGLTALVNPYLAIGQIANTAISYGINRHIETKEDRRNVEYYRRLSGNAFDGSR
jgi:hypothetical protein